jgi:hypothetical protein
MIQNKKFAAAAIIGLLAAVLLFCVAMTLVSDAEDGLQLHSTAISTARPGITAAVTQHGNFVVAMMPDPNEFVPHGAMDSVMLCVGNVADENDNCHEAIPLPVPEELQNATKI